MAMIVIGHSTCFVCDQVLKEDDEIFATSHFMDNPKHPLYPYSDAPAHKRCWLTWKHRAEFTALYNQRHSKDWRGDHITPEGEHAERTPDEFRDWMGADVFARMTGGAGSLPIGLDVNNQPDWFVIDALQMHHLNPLPLRLVRKYSIEPTAYVAGAPADLSLLRGRQVDILRDGRRCGTAQLRNGEFTQMRLAGDLWGYITRITFEPLEKDALQSGDRLRVVPME